MSSPDRRLHVVHLIDDTTAGGVMRVLDHIATSPALARQHHHSIREVARGAISTKRIAADVIVSHLTVSWRGLPGLIALKARHAGIPLVHVEHSYTEHFTALNVGSRRRFHTLLRVAYALFDRVVAVSAAQGAWMAQRRLVSDNRLTVIRSCVDLEAFRALPPVTGPVRVIGAIGRLDRQKGFDTLVSAMRGCARQDIALHVYGEGDEEPALRALADGDPRIHFMGFSADPVAAMAQVDAVAMPSRWEAYGLVALEALAAGRSLLVSGVDGLRDHVENGAVAVAATPRDWSRALALLGTSANPPAAAGTARPEDTFADLWTGLLAELTSGRR